MEILFATPAERREIHQFIREAAREIESGQLLESLFYLENGMEEGGPSGFGWVALNNPEQPTVSFPTMDEPTFDTITTRLRNTTADDLGAAGNPQLQSLASNLSVVAETLEENVRY